MGSKPRHDYAALLLAEKERAIYWICALLARDGPEVREGALQALGELGYDQQRIEATLALGEPGRRGVREASDAMRRPRRSAIAC